MTVEELRRWVEANPGRLNNTYDEAGHSPLFVAALLGSAPIVVWMLDEKGGDVNGTTRNDSTSLHFEYHVDILQAFLARGGDPTWLNWGRYTPISCHVCNGNVDSAVNLLQDSRVRATINVQDHISGTALHHVACHRGDEGAAFIASHLLQAGANPKIKDEDGLTSLAKVQEEHPSYHVTIALLEHPPDAEKTSLLVKARRLIVAATSSAVEPSYLQGRVVRDQSLPRVTLTPLTGGQNDGQNDDDERELRTLLAFMLGMEGGPEGEGMPRDVFRLVMDMLMPAWDPLRRGVVGVELQLQG